MCPCTTTVLYCCHAMSANYHLSYFTTLISNFLMRDWTRQSVSWKNFCAFNCIIKNYTYRATCVVHSYYCVSFGSNIPLADDESIKLSASCFTGSKTINFEAEAERVLLLAIPRESPVYGVVVRPESNHFLSAAFVWTGNQWISEANMIKTLLST